MGNRGKREFIQVLRLMEMFAQAVVAAAVSDAIQLGAIGFDAVKQLVARPHRAPTAAARYERPIRICRKPTVATTRRCRLRGLCRERMRQHDKAPWKKASQAAGSARAPSEGAASCRRSCAEYEKVARRVRRATASIIRAICCGWPNWS